MWLFWFVFGIFQSVKRRACVLRNGSERLWHLMLLIRYTVQETTGPEGKKSTYDDDDFFHVFIVS